ncbi:PAP2 family protein [Weissella confusa]|uniref:phosphatase PAP2 family protein n=1 Tax=Weissella confusa TaxID=1583 RepID=UPI001092A30A|nr:phosphatase PAP2 family protein [Weissella confusa]MBJ7694654.1 phosphatase PAP2 family protein [Weissella confusa]QBZ04015.1 PAP2 family protein [Weissella confusa]
MWHKKLATGISLLAAMIFVVFAVGVMQHASWVTAYDDGGVALIRHFSTAKTAFFKAVTFFAQPVTGVVLTAIAVIVAAVRRRWRIAAYIATSVIGSTVLMKFIKTIVQRPRPTVDRIIPESGFSFPSGHSVNAVAFYGALLVLAFFYLRRRWLKAIVMLVLAAEIILLPISRVYLGVHYPSDVTAGLLLGLVVMLTATTFVLQPKK